ncbi:hypothetical protein Moror_14119 [Moniliophthora roreri MCA 2997]|uniref:FAD-binding domain-containing protein n=1 Tax=Moniliophthora roreri (strain MCA 2997) TaxID=1381753 RepID=V2XPQ8_MONRO|nr:hypothetical protein Moror_14119 [Moniliophthora roreri MCA 2997]
MYQMHRADLQKMLYELASPHMTLRLGSEVAFIDSSAPSVTLKSGEILSGDLVVGADGIHSIVRRVLGSPQEPEPTHDSTYRYLIPADEMLADPELRPLIETSSLASWLGPEKHVVGYGIRGKSLYNMAVHVPEPEFQVPGVYTTKGNPNHMRAAYDKEGENWDPRVRKLLSLAKSDHVLKFKSLHCKPLDTWVHPAGRVTLLGDACHSFPSHYAQGSALAIEDAAVLGNLFSRLTDHSQIKSLLEAYEAIRRPRASATWLDTMERQVWLHYRDGSNQEARDAGIKDTKIFKHRREHEATIPILCANPYGYDADEVVDIWWKQNCGKSVVE